MQDQGPSPAGPSITARIARSTAWIVGWRMASRALGLVSTLLLVRLLSPADFGLVALGTSFVIAVDTLSDLGVEDALVRERAPDPALYATAFTLTAIRGLLTALLIAGAALPIGLFFGEPRLADILWALAAGTVVASLASVGTIDFRRDMAFEREFKLLILPRLVSVAVTIGSAFVWHSYWALVAGILTSRIIQTTFSYRLHPWRPSLTLSAWRRLVGFSLWSWAIGLIQLVRDRVDMFVIGRVLSPTSVGIYAVGEEVAVLPTTEIVQPLCRASFSAFSEARRTGGGTSEAFMRPSATTFLLTLPAGIGIAVVARPLIRLAMGERWLDAVPVLQLLGVTGGLGVFGLVAGTLLSAHAMLRQQFVITLAGVVVRLAALLPLVYQFGLPGAALGACCGLLFEHALLLALVFRQFGLSLRELLGRIWRIVAAGLAMLAVLLLAQRGPLGAPEGGAPGWAGLAGTVGLGIAAYALSLLALWAATGRVAGAESDVVAVATRLVRLATVRLRAGRARGR